MSLISSKFNVLWNWLNCEPRQRIGIRTLQVAIGGVFIFRAFTELPFANYLYGINGIADDIEYAKLYGDFVGGYLDAFFQLDFAAHTLLMVLAVCGICYVVDFNIRLITFLSIPIFNIIVERNNAIADGGDNITQLVLIYMLLLIPAGKKAKEGSLRVWFHNLGVIAIGAQIMILYFTAGFMKITGETWTSGIALFNVSQAEVFSLPAIREIFKNPYISTIASYTTIIFLIWFPIAMFSRLKLAWIFIGILFHLGILGFMGLVTFGVTMIGMELFFITDAEYHKITLCFKDMLERFRIKALWEFIWGKISPNTKIRNAEKKM